MCKPSLIFLFASLFFIVGCYHRESDDTLDAYMQIVNKMKANNSSLDDNIHSKIASMKDRFKRKPDFIPLHKAAKDIFDAIKEFNAYLDDVNKRFYTLAGSGVRESSYNYFYDVEKNKLRNKKLVNDFFINGYQDKYGHRVAPEGVKINNKITETRDKVIAILNHHSNNKNFRIKDDELEDLFSKWLLNNHNISESQNSSWEENTFKNQSVAATYVTLIMLKNDALLSAQMMAYYLSAKASGTIIKSSELAVVISPKKSQVIKGEPFETEIFLAQTSFHTVVTVKVNGKEVEVEKGIATYKVPSAKCGEHTYVAEITVKNPYNNRIETYKETFKYEVGKRCY